MAAPVSVRHSGNLVIAVATWVACVLAMVDAVLRGTHSYILHAAIVVAAIAVAAWIVFFRPRLVIDEHDLRVINVLRRYQVPLGALVDWQVGPVLSVKIRINGDRTRTVTSWGAPGRRKPRARLAPATRRDQAGSTGPADTPSVTQLALDYRMAEWRRTHPADSAPGNPTARVSWSWQPLLLLLALIIARVAVGFL